MHTPSFEAVTAVVREGPGLYVAEVPDGWQQGRGAFGGLVFALLARAMESESGDPARRLRTFTGDIAAPVLPGRAEIRVRVLRRGANQTNLQSELVQGNEVVATATAVCSTPRSAASSAVRPAAPAAEDWRTLESLPIGPPIGPVFAQNYAYRTSGPLPFSEGPEPVAAGFIAERTRLSRLDAPAMLGRLDAWWPAFFTTESGPRLAATISFLAELLVDPAELDPAEPLGYRARVAAAEEGFLVEFRELWAGDRLVAMNQQTFVVIR